MVSAAARDQTGQDDFSHVFRIITGTYLFESAKAMTFYISNEVFWNANKVKRKPHSLCDLILNSFEVFWNGNSMSNKNRNHCVIFFVWGFLQWKLKVKQKPQSLYDLFRLRFSEIERPNGTTTIAQPGFLNKRINDLILFSIEIFLIDIQTEIDPYVIEESQ